MNLNCYIVDDEQHAMDILAEFIEQTPGLTLQGSSTRPLTALQEITDNAPELTFLDIDMPEIGGLEFAGLVHPLTAVIFTTSYREYAPEAFEKEAADYLLKPISYERFLMSIQKIRRNFVVRDQTPEMDRRSFFVKTGVRGQLVRICIPEIVFISSALNYVEIFTREQKIMTYLSMMEIMEKLPVANFSRIHKCHLVNHDYIRYIEHGAVKMTNQSILPIGRAYRSSFLEKIKSEMIISKWDPAQ